MRNKSKKQKYFLFVRSPVALAVSWLKIEPRSRFLFETKCQKKTKRYYLCYNV